MIGKNKMVGCSNVPIGYFEVRSQTVLLSAMYILKIIGVRFITFSTF